VTTSSGHASRLGSCSVSICSAKTSVRTFSATSAATSASRNRHAQGLSFRHSPTDFPRCAACASGEVCGVERQMWTSSQPSNTA
jgi:hypothetical protein